MFSLGKLNVHEERRITAASPDPDLCIFRVLFEQMVIMYAGYTQSTMVHKEDSQWCHTNVYMHIVYSDNTLNMDRQGLPL